MSMKTDKRQCVFHELNYKPVFYSHNDGSTETVPDGALTIRQILDRYATGQPVDAAYREGTFVEGLGDLQKILFAEGGEFAFHYDQVRKAVSRLMSQSSPAQLDNIGTTDTKQPAAGRSAENKGGE